MKAKIFTLLFLILCAGQYTMAQDDKAAAQKEIQRIREEQRARERITREQERMHRTQTRAAGRQQVYCLVVEEKELATGKVNVRVEMGADEPMKEIRKRDLVNEKTKQEVVFTNYLDALAYLSARKWSVSSTTGYQTDKKLVRECLMSKPLPPPAPVTTEKPQ